MLCIYTGCASIKSIKNSGDPYYGGTLKDTFHIWNKTAKIYMGFDLKLKVSATFKSQQFRNAYTKEYIRLYNLTPKEKKKLIADQHNAATTYNDFIMAVFTPDNKLNDFDKACSIWKIHLQMEKQKKIAPIEIRKIKKTDAVINHFFPYTNPWNILYLVRFPINYHGTSTPVISHKASAVKISIASVLGSCNMTWSISQQIKAEHSESKI